MGIFLSKEEKFKDGIDKRKEVCNQLMSFSTSNMIKKGDNYSENLKRIQQIANNKKSLENLGLTFKKCEKNSENLAEELKKVLKKSAAGVPNDCSDIIERCFLTKYESKQDLNKLNKDIKVLKLKRFHLQKQNKK
tara:strand:- start:2946 stop:3350 length:405 start_codon:yes stop_codon:yes gene_type:complete